MKKTITLCILLLFSFLNINGQNCVPIAIVFDTQAEVDAFPTDYPGCTSIEGSLGITGSVTNLDSLIQITSIGEDVLINNSSTLVNVEGLNNVQFIGGYFCYKIHQLQL